MAPSDMMGFSRYDASKMEGDPFVSFERIEELATTDVASVLIELRVDGELFVAEGSSKRNPIDRVDEKLGLALAHARAFRAAAGGLEEWATELRVAQDKAYAERQRRKEQKLLAKEWADLALRDAEEREIEARRRPVRRVDALRQALGLR